MKTLLLKLLGIVTVGIITIGTLVACNNNEKEKSEPISVDASDISFPLEKTETLNILTHAGSDSPQDFNEKILVQRIEEETNVHIDWTVYPSEQWGEKMKLALSKSDLPDVVTNMYIGNYDVLNYAKQGVFIPLEDLIDKSMPNLKKVLEQRPEVKAAITASDGHIYTLPFIEETALDKEAHNVIGAIPWINKKWLDELNLEVPTTTLELETVLRAFKEQKPEGRDDVIPMSFRINQVNQDPGILLGSFGTGDNMDHYMVTNEKKVIYSLAQEDFKEGVNWLHTLYDKGLIDPEAFTQSGGTYLSKAQSGRFGLFLDWNKAFMVSNPEDYVALPALEGPDGTISIPRQNYYSFDMGVTAITSTNSNPALTAKWLDMMFEPLQSIQNMAGTYDDPNNFNIFELTDENTLRYSEIPEGESYSSLSSKQNIRGSFAVLAEYYGKYVDMQSDMANRLEIISNLYAPYITDDYYYPSVFLDSESINRVNQIETDLKAYAEGKKAEWIMKGGADKEWDDYLEKLDEMGLEELIELKQTGFDEFHKKLKELE
ncbi:extracellular solute-binding protein [Bacillus sp. SD088]|uniref:extracellular solute-binding protein n=1 Tax=Bacillus sp. SD088 TaxID=2782012 RepID=UPI001A972C9A|nr:extracellular solute-binding protein [Bacillus sp. SD088]MBO0994918.1 extracellular solute-binding protein [Bacillus sp. SD088]